MTVNLDSQLAKIKGVGSVLAKKYAVLGINTIADLIDYYPRRYDDYSHVQQIREIKPGVVTIKAIIKQAKGRYVRRGLHITEAVASDETGSVRLVWFNQPYRAAAIKVDTEYFVSGLFELSYQRLSIMNPSMELVSDFPISTARIVPIYRESKSTKSSEIRRMMRAVVPLIKDLRETLPGWLVSSQNLISRSQAILAMHFPQNIDQLEKAQRRLGFEEIFQLSMASLLNKYELMQEHSLKIPFKPALARDFVAQLPFKLTDAQRKVIWRIYQDLEKTQPMNRLLEGDVGSGKTVVATMAALMAMEQGYQAAIMAPTELLARQHADTILKLLSPLGYGDQVGLLVGSLKPTQKTAAHKRIKAGDIRLMIGTHALIAQKVDMHKLGLIIIDEQHRFGVEQRMKLQAKAGHAPHMLSMTATPIPRSLALTLYGELDISVIDEKPAERKPIITKIVSPNSRNQLYAKIDKQLAAGRQMFVVCPLISDSETSVGQAAEKVYEQVKKDFAAYRVGLLHGKLKTDDKNKAMRSFVIGKLDILVATTVIEVGVDVPNATVMLIEDAERFGLAQIHQLRGRVGRSAHQGYCYLMTASSQAPSRRLRALETSNNGFELADLDLELRGPGAIYGTMQHGQLDLRVAKLSDTRLIAAARQAAQEFIDKRDDLLKYGELYAQVTELRAITNLN